MEGRELFHGRADVVVCDGFVGNVVLKVGEGVVELLMSLVKQQVQAQLWLKLPAALLNEVEQALEAQLEYHLDRHLKSIEFIRTIR